MSDPLTLQSVMFEKDRWKTITARRWLKKNKYVPIRRVDRKGEHYLYRMNDPDEQLEYITKDLGEGIKMIMGKPKLSAE